MSDLVSRMKSKLKPKLKRAGHGSVDGIRTVFGADKLGLMLLIVLLLASLGWTADYIFERIGGPGLALVFPVLVVLLMVLAWRVDRRLPVRVVEDADPPGARGLVMFLSLLRDQQRQYLIEKLDAGERLTMERIRADETLARMPWRMNLEAIDYHRDRLCRVALIPSRESARQLDLFDRLCRMLWPDARFERVDIGIGDLEFRQNIEALSNAVGRAVAVATGEGGDRRRLSISDVVLDVTSGTALATTAAVAMGMEEGRRIQYVEGAADPNRRYRVLQADITHGER